MPENQLLSSGFTLRVTALDPASGNLVAGAKTNVVVIDADIVTPGAAGDGVTYGDWMFVTGPAG